MTQSRSRLLRNIAAAATSIATVAALAACSGGSASRGATSGSGELAAVKVGVFAAADVAPLYLGIREGFFEDEGLDLEAQILDSGAAVTAAVVADSIQFGYSNTLSLVVASSKGLPVTIVAPGVASGTDPVTGKDANAAVMVAAASPITGIEDLAGKTIAVNALGNILEVTLNNALEKANVDISSVSLVEIPFPEMPATLASGQVDAAFMLEPFITNSKVKDGATPVAFPYEEVVQSLQAGVYFSTESVLTGDPETVAAFQRGLKASVEYANANPDQTRAIVTDYLKIPTDVAEVMKFPQFITEADPSHVDIFLELGQRYGLVDGDLELDALKAGLPQ